jgi:predicted DNA-binding transcriptional regulator AlpA
MEFSPYSIGHAPRSLPVWQTILSDLGNPHPAAVARLLGIGVRTVYRYNRDGQAPRAVCLALFWLTRWGRSEIHCQAVNDCQLAVAYATAMESEVRRLRTELARVLAVGEFGSANDPLASEPIRRRHVSSR